MSLPLLTIILIAIGLAMDAFAVSITRGVACKEKHLKLAIKLGLSFGVFQAAMPVIGWVFGLQLKHIVSTYDHWVAFVLLAGVGLKMLHEAHSTRNDSNHPCACQNKCKDISLPVLLTLSVATSIDALVVGFSFSFLQVTIVTPVVIIGLITFVFSFIGVFLGRSCCSLLGKKAEYFGGLVLVGVGLKILFIHIF